MPSLDKNPGDVASGSPAPVARARRPKCRAPRGKIAHLPYSVRNEVNQKILDGFTPNEILAWLNALPVVQERMAALFHGKPVNPQNLWDWRWGQYVVWERERKIAAVGLN